MFADLDQINAVPRSTAVGGSAQAGQDIISVTQGAKVSAAEAPLKEEVQHKLQHLAPALFSKCQQVSVLSAGSTLFDLP